MTAPTKAIPAPDQTADVGALDTCQRELSIQVLKKFRLIFGSVRQHFRIVEENCGVSGSQLWVLQEVSRSPGVGVSEVATRLSIHQSTCSQLVEKLVANDLLIKMRSREDQRRVGLTATAAGLALLAHAPGPAEGVLPDALMSLQSDSLLNLDMALAEVIERLPAGDANLSGKPLADM